MYIGSLLANVRSKINDDKQKLVSLVGVIELLLTHNPNFNRFNVEDSISKQFKLKTSILLYKNDDSIDLNKTKKQLIFLFKREIEKEKITNFTLFLISDTDKLSVAL